MEKEKRTCDWRECNEAVSESTQWKTEYQGTTYYFCCEEHKRRFDQENPPDS